MTSTSPVSPDSPRRDAAVRYLLDRINFERLPNLTCPARQFKLDSITELLRRLDSPQCGMPVIHIAGTKGKGSTATLIGAILSAAGYRVGLFTSPHLERIEERFVVDGRPCSPGDLADLVELVKPAVAAMDREAILDPDSNCEGPTYFDLTTAMAFLHFARRAADVAILEVGLGGRLDSTNVCEPMVSIITSISYDHTALLGNDLKSIAAEKAGILKPQTPAVSGVTRSEPREVIRRMAQGLGCRLVEAGVDFNAEPRATRWNGRKLITTFDYSEPGSPTIEGLELSMPGRHQVANAAVALATVGQLRKIGWNISPSAVRIGLSKGVCAGRVEILDTRPITLLDVAHNRASIEALAEVLGEHFADRRKWVIFAASGDKDLRGMLEVLLPVADEIVFTKYIENPRAASPQHLGELAKDLTGRAYPVCENPEESWKWVSTKAREDDLICVTGSFFIVGEIWQQFFNRESE